MFLPYFHDIFLVKEYLLGFFGLMAALILPDSIPILDEEYIETL